MTTALGGDLPDWTSRVSSTDDIALGTYTWSIPGSSPIIDVSEYASVIINVASGGTAAAWLVVSWLDPSNNLITQDYMTQYAGAVMPNIVLPVRSQNMQLSYAQSGIGHPFVQIYGSQRQVPQAVSQGFFSPVTASVAAQSLVANSIYTVLPAGPQGWVQIDLVIGSSTVTGEWLIGYNDTNGNAINQRFADTSEFHTVSGNQVFHGQVIMPHVPYQLRFICRTAGTASLGCNMIALGR